MKKLISCFVILCHIVTVCTTGFAAVAQSPVVAKYDSQNTALAVSADFGASYADLLTTLTVFKAGQVISDSSLPLLFQSVFANDDGEINLSLSIPSSFASDKYTVRVANEKGTYDADFLYAKNSDIRAVMLLLNDAETTGEISAIVTSNYTKLALDPIATAPFITELADAYLTICSSTDYTDEKVFYSDFMQCLAAAEITYGTDVSTVLNNYKVYIGSAVDEIRTYPSSVQTLLTDYIGSCAYADGLLSNQIPKLRTLAFFKSSSTWGEAKLNILGQNASGTKYIDNFDVLSPDLTYYNQVGNVNLVYEGIFSQRIVISTFDGLKTAFETAAKSVYDSENSGGSTGGSLGGSPSIPTASVAPGSVPQTGTQSSRFTDTNGHWAQSQIEELANKNVISGYPDGTFAPDKNVTRAEFAKMIMSYAGLGGQADSMNFTDVNISDWFYAYISGAVSNGLINGISDSQFAPNTPITRQDACVIIYRYLGNKISLAQIAAFADFDLVSDYAADAVSALSQNGILTGYEDNTFKPQNSITRAETAVILSRVTEFLK